MDKKQNHILGCALGFILLTVLDQWSKKLVVSSLMGKPAYVIWDGVFELLYSENRGAAFGMLQGRQGFFFLVAVIVCAAVIYVIVRLPAAKRYLPLEICITAIAAGAAGNMIDRVIQGYVVDFLYFKLINFPIFNVADCYVTTATAVLMILLLWFYKDEEFKMLKPGRKEKI